MIRVGDAVVIIIHATPTESKDVVFLSDHYHPLDNGRSFFKHNADQQLPPLLIGLLIIRAGVRKQEATGPLILASSRAHTRAEAKQATPTPKTRQRTVNRRTKHIPRLAYVRVPHVAVDRAHAVKQRRDQQDRTCIWCSGVGLVQCDRFASCADGDEAGKEEDCHG